MPGCLKLIIAASNSFLTTFVSIQIFTTNKLCRGNLGIRKPILNILSTLLKLKFAQRENKRFLGIKSTAKMQEYILITDVSLNTYSIFRAKKTLNIILSY